MTTTGKRAKRLMTPAIGTREQMEQCVGEIADLMIERDSLTVAMDARIKAVRDAYQERLADMEADIEAELALAAEWAEANRAAFGDRKSIEMVHGTVGFRTGNPTLKTLTGWTWNLVLERLAQLPSLIAYIRQKTEVDKEKLLADRETLGERLREIGCRVVQNESFFCEPKREQTPGNCTLSTTPAGAQAAEGKEVAAR